MHTKTIEQSKADPINRVQFNNFGDISRCNPSDSSLNGVNMPAPQINGIARVYGVEVGNRHCHVLDWTTPCILQELQVGLLRATAETTYLHGLNDQADFFSCGLGSLQVTQINGLLMKLKSDTGEISKQVIYENASYDSLLAVLQCFLAADGKSEL